ncbi:hypothetical protein, partial [Sulfuricurvum sp.]|uniref:hypothetical protein n=1 Tax=Sulfuricurvum sp. TaxID=2025608 RepID=UPI003BB60087
KEATVLFPVAIPPVSAMAYSNAIIISNSAVYCAWALCRGELSVSVAIGTSSDGVTKQIVVKCH